MTFTQWPLLLTCVKILATKLYFSLKMLTFANVKERIHIIILYTMEKPINKYISLTYKLYTKDEDGKQHLVEEATAERPFLFISGYGIALEAFEEQTAALPAGSSFAFDLDKEQAYGDYDEDHVVELARDVFCINGHFDHEHIYKDAIVPLQNEDGNRFYGRVVDLDGDKVRMDLNHPLAGETLHFEGVVIENRDATNSEIEQMVNRMSGEGCGCGCDHDHCNGDHDHCNGGHDHCGCGHKEHDHCCGHHHCEHKE